MVEEEEKERAEQKQAEGKCGSVHERREKTIAIRVAVEIQQDDDDDGCCCSVVTKDTIIDDDDDTVAAALSAASLPGDEDKSVWPRKMCGSNARPGLTKPGPDISE